MLLFLFELSAAYKCRIFSDTHVSLVVPVADAMLTVLSDWRSMLFDNATLDDSECGCNG